MTKITASDVNNLRKISGAGIMGCKNAVGGGSWGSAVALGLSFGPVEAP